MNSSTSSGERRPPADRAALSKNRETVQAYERCARDYAQATAPQAPLAGSAALHRLLHALRPGSRVLEVGSGPGWDADFLEAHGVKVRRTDICAAFLEFQNERGKSAERLDVIKDALGGPYDGVLALYVLQHVDRTLVPAVLQNVRGAMRPGGVFLASFREGAGDVLERSARSGSFHVTLWPLAAFEAQLSVAGLSLLWADRSSDDEGDWVTVLATR